ncbi:hypothetical protein EDD86DRAFT_87424 [Gorgonomyces haynaldii]|nr:hypothetical protein EDD86DRAFT_87424 [Gorgonomyces haynaldii]
MLWILVASIRAQEAYGSCGKPSIQFGGGLDGRQQSDTSYKSSGGKNNLFNHGTAQDFDTIAQFICDRLNDQKCKPAQTRCDDAKREASKAKRGQDTIDKFFSVLEQSSVTVPPIVQPSPSPSPSPSPAPAQIPVQIPIPKQVPETETQANPTLGIKNPVTTLSLTVDPLPVAEPTANSQAQKNVETTSDQIAPTADPSTSVLVPTLPVEQALNPEAMDAIYPFQIAVIVVEMFVYALSCAAFALVWRNRDYAPFKSKQLPLLTIGLVAGFFWSVGTMEGVGILTLDGCVFWTVFLQYCFGVHLYLTVFIVRLLRLYWVMIRLEGPDLLHHCLIALSWVPSLIMGIVAAAMGSDAITPNPVFKGITKVCIYNWGPLFAFLFIWTLLQLVVLAYLNHRLISVKKAFNEYRETRWALLVMSVTVLVIFALKMAGAPKSIAGKVIICFIQMISAISLFWSSFGWTLYGFFFYKDQQLEEWKRSFRDDYLPSDFKSSVDLSVPEKTQSIVSEKSWRSTLVRKYAGLSANTGRSQLSVISEESAEESVEEPPRVMSIQSIYSQLRLSIGFDRWSITSTPKTL